MIKHANTDLGRVAFVLGLVLIFFCAGPVRAQQTTSFTYQGRLTDGGAPANANYDLQFTLWDAGVGGNQQPQPAPAALTKTNVAVTGGVFSVLLDFGVSAFPGADRFLEIGVRPGGTAVAFTLLAPRQQISSTPYAIRTLNASSADSLSNACVSCVTDTQISSVAASKLTGTIPPSSLPAGGSFIQNSTGLQLNANFDISGNGTAGGTLSGNVVNAATQYNIGGNRILSAPGTNNLFAGTGAGQTNTTGRFNSFFGYGAGSASSTDDENSFFGYNAGRATNGGKHNAFFGTEAGGNNTTGGFNAFFGREAGFSNTNGGDNSFFGDFAGFNNKANGNSFFGSGAGQANTTGSQNAFFGSQAGRANTGGGNVLLGSYAASNNLNGNENTVIGQFAGQNLTTGFRNILIGSLAGNNGSIGVNGNENIFVGTNFPQCGSNGFGCFKVVKIGGGGSGGGTRSVSVGGDASASFDDSTAIGAFAQTFSNFSTAIGAGARAGNNGGKVGTAIGAGAVASGFGSTAIGAGALATNDNTIVLGGPIPFSGFPTVQVPGVLTVGTLGSSNGSTQLCRNNIGQLSFCSSSLRYKTDVHSFLGGLDVVERLRPISFTWKQGGSRDIGLGAEDVEKVEPLLTFRNERGEIEGVKYQQLNVILVNAIKEQEREIEQLRVQVRQLRAAAHRPRVRESK